MLSWVDFKNSSQCNNLIISCTLLIKLVENLGTLITNVPFLITNVPLSLYLGFNCTDFVVILYSLFLQVPMWVGGEPVVFQQAV